MTVKRNRQLPPFGFARKWWFVIHWLLALATVAPCFGQTVGSPHKPQLILQTGGGGLQGLAFLSNDRQLVSSGWHVVTLWDLDSGLQIRTFKGGVGGDRVAVSQDEQWIASESEPYERDERLPTVVIWEAGTGRVVRSFPKKSNANDGLAFTPDNQWLVVGYGKDVNLVDVKTGAIGRVFSGLSYDVTALTMSKDGHLLAAGDESGHVMVWDVSNGQEVGDLTMEEKDNEWETIDSLTFAPDGTVLVASTQHELKMWEPASGRFLQLPLVASDYSRSVVFSPDGKYLAWSEEGEIKLWDVQSHKRDERFKGKAKGELLAFSQDGHWLASFSSFGEDRIQILDFSTAMKRREIKTSTKSNSVESVAITADSRFLVLGGVPGLVVWDTTTGEGRYIHVIETHAIAVSPTGAWFATGNGAMGGTTEVGLYSSLTPGGEVKLASLTPGGEVKLEGHVDTVQSVAFSPDGRWLASGSEDESIKIWDLTDKKLERTLKGHTSAVLGIAYSPDGRVLASASADRTVKVWDPAEGKELRTLTGHKDEVTAVAFSPDGHFLASASVDSTVRIWDVTSGAEVQRMGDFTELCSCLAFGPEGYLAVPTGNTITLWDVKTGQRLREFVGHASLVRSVSFAPNGRWLVSGSDDGSARFWSPSSGEELFTLSVTRNLDWIALTPEGLFDGSENGTRELIAWQVGTRMYPPDKFFSDYYTPGLMERIFAGERPKPKVDIASLKLPPEVKILSPSAGTAKKDQAIVAVHAEDLGGGIGEVRLFQNGKLVGTHFGTPGQKTGDFAFEAQLAPGENVFRAVAVSAEKVEGNDDTVRLILDAPPNPALHLMVVGINHYEDPAMNLHFAHEDGEAIAHFFEQRGAKLFTSVDTIRLFDENATQANIRSALDKLAERAKPEDLVIVYLAGHGITIGQQFYFLPHEMHPEGDDEEAAIRKYGLSATALGEELGKIKALKQVLILDACQSEQALQLLAKVVMFRGAAEERKATRMLARSRGVYLIAASTKQQYAAEVPELGHGVLTYALLSALGEKGAPQAPTTPEGFVTVTSLLQYVNQQVPELTQQYHHEKQYPVSFNTGMDFPLLVR